MGEGARDCPAWHVAVGSARCRGSCLLGNLTADFNFNQKPRPPLILSLHPAPGASIQAAGGLEPAGFNVIAYT